MKLSGVAVRAVPNIIPDTYLFMFLDYYVWYQNATLLHKNLLKPLRNGDGSSASKVHYENAKLNYLRVAREISGQLSESLVKFDYGLIAVGLALTTSVCIKYYHALIL